MNDFLIHEIYLYYKSKFQWEDWEDQIKKNTQSFHMLTCIEFVYVLLVLAQKFIISGWLFFVRIVKTDGGSYPARIIKREYHRSLYK